MQDGVDGTEPRATVDLTRHVDADVLVCARLKRGLNEMRAALAQAQSRRTRSTRQLLVVVTAIFLGVVVAIGITTRGCVDVFGGRAASGTERAQDDDPPRAPVGTAWR